MQHKPPETLTYELINFVASIILFFIFVVIWESVIGIILTGIICATIDYGLKKHAG